MHIRGNNARLLSLSCVSIMSIATSAMAQEAAPAAPASPAAATQDQSDFDDIVVTARRREESAQSVPVAVTAVSGEALTQQNITNLTDLPRVAPGLTVTPSALGSTRPVYQIRGQRAAATRITTDPAVVVYFAEVGSARAAGSAQSMFDIQSVQVLKGPQGTLFGRNTTGGAILITPTAPSRDFEGYVTGSIGNYELMSVEGVLNIPFNDVIQLRAAAKVYRRNGYFNNVARPAEPGFDENNQSYRVTLRVQPTDAITSDTIGTIFHSDVVGFAPKIQFLTPSALPSPALIPSVSAAFARSNALGFYEFGSPHRGHNVDTTQSIQNNTSIELSDTLTLKNIIAYKNIKNDFTNAADGTDLGLLQTNGYYRGWQFSEELQLQGDIGPVEFVVGGFYSVEKGRDYTRSVSFGGGANFTDFDGTNKSLSGFAHANVELGGGFSVNAGARLTQDKRLIISHQRQARTPPICLATGVAVPITNVDDLSQCSVATRATFVEPTWNLGVNWQITPKNLLYIAHRRGYRAGAARSAQSPDLRPEIANDIEIGSKNDFRFGDVPVRFNLIGYYGKYKDLQRNIAINLNGSPSTQDRNAAKAHVYGFETELNVRFAEAFSLNANYALTKARYDEYENTFITPAGPVVVDNRSSIFSYAPEHMLSITAAVDIPVGEGIGEPTISATYSYQSSFHTTDSNSYNCGPNNIERWCLNTIGKLAGYGLLNGRVDWRNFLDSPVDLAFFVTNLTNKKYLAGAYALNNVLGFQTSWPGAPRMFGIEARVRFGAAAN